jgi:hypothetical protein
MKKQLLLLSALSVFAGVHAWAQNADPDQSSSPIQVIEQKYAPVRQSPGESQLKSGTDAVAASCMPASMCPQTTTFTGNVRGYFFVAPASFMICGLLVPTDASTGPQSIEVVKFNGVMPPAYPSVTNSFTSLFYVAGDTGLVTPVSCNILVNAGDTIGVYGARSTSTICSYGMASCQITILGDTVTLTRSGMQFPLYNQQMHDIWSAASSSISRIIMYVDAVTGIAQPAAQNQFSIAPNPGAGVFSVKMKQPLSTDGGLEVYDVTGSRVYTAGSDFNGSIDLSGQAEGLYFVVLKSGGRTFTQKVIVAR